MKNQNETVPSIPAKTENLAVKNEVQKGLKELEFSEITNGLESLSKKVLKENDQKVVKDFLKLGEVEKAFSIFQNEKELGKFNKELTELKTKFSKIQKLGVLDRFTGEGKTFDSIDDVVDEFTEKDAKGVLRMRKMSAVIKDSMKAEIAEKGYVKGFFSGIPNALKMGFLYARLEKHKNALLLYPRAKETAKTIINTGKEIQRKVSEAKTVIKGVADPLKETPAAKNMVTSLKRKFKARCAEIFKSGRKISPEKLKEEVQFLTQEISSEGMKKGGKPFLEAVSQNKFPGLTLKTTGKFMVIEVLSQGLLSALRKGELGAFPETLAQSNIWLEAIPGVGSYKSLNRLFSANGDPIWIKGVDAGINVLGDGILLAGIVGSVFTFGATGAAGLAARAGIQTTGKSLLKTFTVKEVIKEGASQAAKKGMQKLTTKEGQKLLAKGSLKLAGSTIKTKGILSLSLYAVEQIFQTIFPEKKVADVVLETALTPEQQTLVQNLSGTQKEIMEKTS